MIFFLCLCIAVLVLWMRGRLEEQDRRIAALTARLFELESRGAPGAAPVPAQSPSPAIAPGAQWAAPPPGVDFASAPASVSAVDPAARPAAGTASAAQSSAIAPSPAPTSASPSESAAQAARAEWAAAQGPPAQETPAQETPAHWAAAQGTSAQWTPAQGTSAQGAAAPTAEAEWAAAPGTPAQETPAHWAAAQGTPAHGTAPPEIAGPPPLPAFGPPPPAATPPPAVDAVAGPAPASAVDIESLIGGNWLSKLGVLMLLIGVALFVGFSLTEMGPLGRILTGAATSLALLGAGVAAERKDNYRVLGSALIGGGWAGLYFTAYAAHGVEASRVIDNPGVGLFLLLGVAAGMILHSLRYRNQTVTGLAYMAAFLTIAISSLTQYSAVASVPLLISLLAVAWKFGWQPLAGAGALFAYAAYGFDLATGDKDRYFVLIGEPFLWTYWFLIEGFDLTAKHRGAKLPIAPLNLCGFLFAMAAVWPSGSGWQPGAMLATMAVAQLVSALLRGRLEREDETIFGGFRASITCSAGFAAAFIIEHFTGLQRGLTLALLAESVALSGWLFKNSYLRGLAAVLFVVTVVGAHSTERPLYWALATMFVVNRLFLLGGVWYTAGAVAALGGLLTDFDPRHLRPVLLTIGAGALGLALRWREKPEARWAGLALAVLSVAVLVSQIPSELIWVTIGLPFALYAAFGAALMEGEPRLATFVLMQFYAGALLYRLLEPSPWLMPAWAGLALVCWAIGWQRQMPSLSGSVWLPEAVSLAYWAFDLLGKKQDLAPQVLAIAMLFAMFVIPGRGAPLHGAAASLALTALLQEFVSGRRLTLAWSVEAITLLAAGIGLHRRQLRLSGLLLFAVCMGKLFFWDFSQLDTMSRILSFIGLGCLLIAASWAYSRFREQIHSYL